MKRLIFGVTCLPFKKRKLYHQENLKTIEKTLLCRSCYPLFALYEFTYLINTLRHFIIPRIIFFAVAAMFLHAKITLYFNIQRERFCLPALHMRVNIHAGPPCRDDVHAFFIKQRLHSSIFY